MLLKFILASFVVVSSRAVEYKIGSKVFVRPEDVEKIYAKLGAQGFSREMIKNRMIYTRSVVRALQLAKQIPEIIKHNTNLVGYESDEALLLHYIRILNEHFEVTQKEKDRLRDLYAQIKVPKLYFLRELVVNSVDEKILDGYKNIIASSDNKLKEFALLARKHSIAKSAKVGGKIGLYNPIYDSDMAKILENAKAGDVFVQTASQEGEKCSVLYFVESVVSYNVPSDEALVKEVKAEKVAMHIAVLLERFPVEVVEIS